MKQRHSFGIGEWKRLVISRWVSPSLAGGLGLAMGLSQCQGQQTLLETTTPIFVQASKQVNWFTGPQKISLGDVAIIDLPAGYRLTGKEGAQRILEDANTAVPDDLIGAVIANSGNWMAVLEYNAKGYVKDAQAAQINTEKVLQEAQTQARSSAQAGTASSISLIWQSLPAFDDNAHSLSWSLQVHDGPTTVLNEAVAILGRRGVLQMTAVQPFPATDTTSLKQMAGSISFKQGEQFADYRDGDPVATAGLAELIVGAREPQAAGFTGTAAIGLVYGSLILLVGLPVGFLVWRRVNRRSTAQAPATAMAQKAVTNGSAAAPALAMQGAEASAPQAAAASINNGNSGSRNRRKKMFDYPKFYTDVIQQLSLHAYGTGFTPINGKTNGNGYVNGNGNGNGKLNGYANGHANGHSNSNGHQNGHSDADVNGNGLMGEMIKAQIVELIATQKNLIEEQKLLLEQQTRLIEEKRWLIEEQTAFLRGQAELIDTQQYPLKLE